MPVNLSIKNVPEALVERLKQRAASHYRSMQGEVMAILEEATQVQETLSSERIERILADIKAIGNPNTSMAAAMVREDRDR